MLAKKYLVGIKENALKSLVDQGMLVEPIEIVLHENVMPWVIDKMADFLNDEDFIEINTEDVIRDAFDGGKDSHKKAIEAEYKRRQDVIEAEE